MALEVLAIFTALGIGAYISRPLFSDKRIMPLGVFIVAYTFLFFLGALGIHFDAESYFSDWIASIGVREVYLTPEQRWMHLITILSPYFMLPLGCRFGQDIYAFLHRTFRRLKISPTLGILLAALPIFIAYPFGSFWFSMALLWSFTFLIFTAKFDRLFIGFFRKISFGHLLIFCFTICALMLFKNNAFGSIYSFFIQYQDQSSLLAQRSNLTVGLPIWYWAVAYTLLPMACASYVLQTPRPSMPRLALALAATSWILFAHFFKGQIFYFILFIVFCAGSYRPRWLIKGAFLTAVLAIGLLSGFYLTASGLSGDPKQSWLLLTHFFYRLGTNQHFYLAFFPNISPFLGLDIFHSPHLDAQLVYGFMYPGDLMNNAGSTAGPYISNAWSQGGLLLVLVYGFISGALLQWFWLFAGEFKGTIRLIFRGRILFIAFLLAQLSFRDFLFSGWGLVWGCMGILILKSFVVEKEGKGEDHLVGKAFH